MYTRTHTHKVQIDMELQTLKNAPEQNHPENKPHTDAYPSTLMKEAIMGIQIPAKCTHQSHQINTREAG